MVVAEYTPKILSLGLALWRCRLSHLQCQLPICALVWIPAGPLLIQLPATAPGKAEEGGPNPWGPCTHLGDLDGVFKAPGPILAIMTTWGNAPRSNSLKQNNKYLAHKLWVEILGY